MTYDSKADTLEHIRTVQEFLGLFAISLIERGVAHDASKLVDPEKEAFDRMTPLLKSLTYGSDEYKASLAELGVALKHHYAANSHHPEHYENGIDGMDLLDVVEMYCDWCAAIRRTKDGSMPKSLEVNKGRFAMSDQLVAIFENTSARFGS